MDLKIKLTHRGPLMSYELLQVNAGLLFSGAIPENKFSNDIQYSFGWGGAYVGDSSLDFLKTVSETKDIPSFLEKMETLTEETGYRGLAGNLIAADTSGNIAYQLIVPMPERKD